MTGKQSCLYRYKHQKNAFPQRGASPGAGGTRTRRGGHIPALLLVYLKTAIIDRSNIPSQAEGLNPRLDILRPPHSRKIGADVGHRQSSRVVKPFGAKDDALLRYDKGVMKRKLLILLLPLLAAASASMIGARVLIEKATRDKTYTDLSLIPHRHVGLVLGCPKLSGGYLSLFFKNRIDAAAELYRAGKVDYLIASGANHQP